MRIVKFLFMIFLMIFSASNDLLGSTTDDEPFCPESLDLESNVFRPEVQTCFSSCREAIENCVENQIAKEVGNLGVAENGISNLNYTAGKSEVIEVGNDVYSQADKNEGLAAAACSHLKQVSCIDVCDIQRQNITEKYQADPFKVDKNDQFTTALFLTTKILEGCGAMIQSIVDKNTTAQAQLQAGVLENNEVNQFIAAESDKAQAGRKSLNNSIDKSNADLAARGPTSVEANSELPRLEHDSMNMYADSGTSANDAIDLKAQSLTSSDVALMDAETKTKFKEMVAEDVKWFEGQRQQARDDYVLAKNNVRGFDEREYESYKTFLRQGTPPQRLKSKYGDLFKKEQKFRGWEHMMSGGSNGRSPIEMQWSTVRHNQKMLEQAGQAYESPYAQIAATPNSADASLASNATNVVGQQGNFFDRSNCIQPRDFEYFYDQRQCRWWDIGCTVNAFRESKAEFHYLRDDCIASQ